MDQNVVVSNNQEKWLLLNLHFAERRLPVIDAVDEKFNPCPIFVLACLHAIYASMHCTYTFVPTHFTKLFPMMTLLSAFVVLFFQEIKIAINAWV